MYIYTYIYIYTHIHIYLCRDVYICTGAKIRFKSSAVDDANAWLDVLNKAKAEVENMASSNGMKG